MLSEKKKQTDLTWPILDKSVLAVAHLLVNFQAVVHSVISCALIIAHILQSLKTGGASKICKHRLVVSIEMHCGM